MTPLPRVGTGVDVHPFADGRELRVAGLLWEGERGLAGHSDADVLLHAIGDALVGAAGLPDIGRLFPPDQAQWKDADSWLLLQAMAQKVRGEGWMIANVDAVLIAQAPKISPFVPAMRERIAAALGASIGQVNLRGKTAEGMDDVGAGRGMVAHAVCLLARSPEAAEN